MYRQQRLPAALALAALALALHGLAAASFLPPVFTDSITGRPLSYAATGSSVFVLTLLNEDNNYYITRYDAGNPEPVWQVPRILARPSRSFISVDGASVVVYYERGTDGALMLLELDAATGESAGSSVVDASFAGADGYRIQSGIHRYNGEAVALLDANGGVPGRVLPSGLELPTVNLNGDEVAYIGGGKIVLMERSSPNIVLRVVDAVNGMLEPQKFEVPNPGSFPIVHMSGNDGHIYFAWETTQPGDYPPFQVFKINQDTMEVVWQREISYNIGQSGSSQRALRCARSITARDGLVGVSVNVFVDSRPDLPFIVEGVELTKPEEISPVGDGYQADEAVVITLDDSDGSTLSVGNTKTVGGESCLSRGGVMLNDGVYALLGSLDLTDVGTSSIGVGIRTGRTLAFFIDDTEECVE